MYKAIIIICSLVFFITSGLYLDKLQRFVAIRKYLHSKTIPAELSKGNTIKILKQQCLIKIIKDRSQKNNLIDKRESLEKPVISSKETNLNQYLYTPNFGGPQNMPSSLIINKKDLKDNCAVLSVVVDAKDLYGIGEGIISNSKDRGKQWERLAYVSYYEGKRLLFATSAGLRYHGGEESRRNPYRKKNSFRLYFRDIYGGKQLPLKNFFDTVKHPLRTIVIREGNLGLLPGQSAIYTGFTFDIFREIGVVAPEAKPVLFFLNGQPKGIYALIEHQSRKQWRLHLGHDNFTFYRYCFNPDKESLKVYKQLSLWAENTDIKMTIKEANKKVDLDNLSRYLFAVIFCGDTNWKQGVMILDKNIVNGRWFWVVWDVDHSFSDFANRDSNRANWQQEALELLMSDKIWWKRDGSYYYKNPGIRTTLFRRLLNEDPEYKDYFVRLVMDLLNHRLNSDFLNSRLDYYTQIVLDYRVKKTSFLRKLKNFIDNRSDFVRGQISQELNAGPIFSCEIKAPSGITYEVDGYPKQGYYKGKYFKGKKINVRIIDRDKTGKIYWLVNGNKILVDNLVYPVNSTTTIKLALEKS